MLIRNAKDTAGKPIEVWLRGDKIAAIGQGLVVPEGEDVLDAKGLGGIPEGLPIERPGRSRIRGRDKAGGNTGAGAEIMGASVTVVQQSFAGSVGGSCDRTPARGAGNGLDRQVKDCHGSLFLRPTGRGGSGGIPLTCGKSRRVCISAHFVNILRMVPAGV